MDQATIGALLCGAIFLLALGIASERAIVFRAKALREERLRIGLQGEVDRAGDEIARLTGLLGNEEHKAAMLTAKLDRLQVRHDARTTLIADMVSVLAAARAKLAKFDGSARPRGAGGRFGRAA